MVNVQIIWKWLAVMLSVIVLTFHVTTIIGNFINTPLDKPILLSVDISVDDQGDDMDDYREGALKEVLFAFFFHIQKDLTSSKTFPNWTNTFFFIKIKPLISRNIDSGLFDIPPPHFENSFS